MRPRGVPSKWVKLLPWYYTERREPSRADELRAALRTEDLADPSGHEKAGTAPVLSQHTPDGVDETAPPSSSSHERQWFCYCTNKDCSGGSAGWRCADGTREFYIYGEEPVNCPECGLQGAVYPY